MGGELSDLSGSVSMSPTYLGCQHTGRPFALNLSISDR